MSLARQAAARRRISFPRSNRRSRTFSSRFPAYSAAARPAPESLRPAVAIQRLSVVTESPEPFAICVSGPRPCGPHQ